MTKIISILSILLFLSNFTHGQTPSDVPCNAPTITASGTPGTPINANIALCCNSYINFLGTGPTCGTAQTDRDSWFKINNMTAGEQYNFMYIETGNRQTWVEIFELPAGKDCAVATNFKTVKCARANNVAFFPGSTVSATFTPPNAGSTYYARFQRVNVSDQALEGTFSVTKSYPNEEPCTASLLQTQPSQGTNPTFGNTITAADWKPDVLTGPTCGSNNDVWYKFVATACSMQIFVDNLSQSSYEMQAALMAATNGDCNNQMEIVPCGGQPDQYLDIMLSADNLTVGKTYYVIVDGYSPPYINAVGNFSIEVFKKPNGPECPKISSPCECGDPLTCGGTVLPNSVAGNAALAAALANPSANGCFNFAQNTPPAPPLCGGSNTVEFCTKYTALAGDELIAFDNIVNADPTCEVLSTKNIAYEEGICAAPINSVCLDYNKKSPVFKVEAGKTYRFCRQVVTNGADADCVGKTYQSFCAFLWKMPASSTSTQTICNGESVTIGTNTYNTSGTTTTKIVSPFTGCDSTVTLNLTVLPKITSAVSTTICNGETFTVGNTKYGTSGTFTVIIKALNGCDSTVTLTLNVLPAKSSNLTTTICAESTLTVGTSTFDKTGTYTVVVKTPNQSCDSTVNVNLTVAKKIGSTLNKTVCVGGSFTINGETYSTTGNFDQKLKAANGCDSTFTVALTVLPDLKKSISEGICEGSTYTFGKQVLTKSGVYTEVFKTSIGCDSTVVLTLNVSKKVEKKIKESICEGGSVKIGPNTYTTTGIYTVTIGLAGGCDSTVILDLTVNPKKTFAWDKTVCFGEKVTIDGKDYDKSGTIVTKTKAGCDSTIILNLTVKPKNETILNRAICDGKTVEVNGVTYSTAGTFPIFSGKDKMGCDSTATVIIVKEDLSVAVSTKEASCAVGAKDGGATVTSPIGPGYTYIWSNGQTGAVLKDVADGPYTVTVTSSSGCTKAVPVSVPKREIPKPQFDVTDVNCANSTGGALAVKSPIGAGFTYQWSNNSQGISITGLKKGDYTVTVADPTGCTSVGTGTVSETPLASINISKTGAICESLTGSATINPTVAMTKYKWSNGSDSISIKNVKGGEYSVTGTDNNGCTSTGKVTIDKSSATFTVTVIPNNVIIGEGATTSVKIVVVPKVADFELSLNPVGTITVTGTKGDTIFATIKPTVTGKQDKDQVINYQVIVKDKNTTCSGSGPLSVTIKSFKIQFPSVITPDETDPTLKDNTILQPVETGVEVFTQYSVFNRWGERVYHIDTPTSPDNMKKQGLYWNCNYDNEVSGKKCPTDVYIIVAKYKTKIDPTGEEKTHSQDFTVLR